MTRKQLLKLLADMLFSYVNKDEDVPHGFEVEAVPTERRRPGARQSES